MMLVQGMLEGSGPHPAESHKDQPVLAYEQLILSTCSSSLQALLPLYISRRPRHPFYHFSAGPLHRSLQHIDQDEASRYYHVLQRVGRSCSSCRSG